MAFQIHLSDTVADAKEISLLVGHAFRSDEPFKSMFQDCSETEYFQWCYSTVFERLNRPGCQTYKMIEVKTNKIVSYFTVQHPYVMSKKEKAKPPPLSHNFPPGANIPLVVDTFAMMGTIRPKNGFDPEIDYMGSMVVTHPLYQHQGHAKKLIELGLRFADQKKRNWYAACWPASTNLYKKLGFRQVAEETVDLSRYGGEGKTVMTLLVRDRCL